MADKTSERIKDVSKSLIGVFTALTSARATLGDEVVNSFLDQVSETGEALWIRFTTFRKEKSTADLEVNFGHFIASVVMPQI